MPKRRNVLAGLGALAFGSGAVSVTGALSSTFTQPSADLRVVADAGLRVRAARDENGVLNVDGQVNTVASLTTPSSFFNPSISNPGQPSVVDGEILQDAVNDNLAMQTVHSLRQSGSFDPLIEIINDTSSSVPIGINYAETDSSGNVDSPSGYGADVDTSAGNYGGPPSSGTVTRELVQSVYQFKTTTTAITGSDPGVLDDDNTLISPDPAVSSAGTADEAGSNTISIPSGQKVLVKLEFDTTSGPNLQSSNIPGQINSAAGQGGFSNNANVDLLDTIFVSDES